MQLRDLQPGDSFFNNGHKIIVATGLAQSPDLVWCFNTVTNEIWSMSKNNNVDPCEVKRKIGDCGPGDVCLWQAHKLLIIPTCMDLRVPRRIIAYSFFTKVLAVFDKDEEVMVIKRGVKLDESILEG
jgi:hypothetical protein